MRHAIAAFVAMAAALTVVSYHGAHARDVSQDVLLDDLLFVTQANPAARLPGCNSASVLSFQGGPPIFQAARPDVDFVDGFAATTDFRHVFVLASSSNPPVEPVEIDRRQLMHLVRLGDGWSDWSLDVPISGAPFSYDRSFAILPDDDTLLVELFGLSGDTGSTVAKYCLSEIKPDGTLGPQRGSFSSETPPRQVIPSADGRRAYLISEYGGSFIILDSVTMQPVGPPIPMISDGGDSEWHNEFFGSISTDERYIVTRRRIEDALGVIDLVDRKAWLLPMNGLCGRDPNLCGEVAFNHGPVNHGLLAVRGRTQLAVFEFVPRGPLRKLGRLPLTGDPELEWKYMPLAWSGDGQYIAVGASRPNGDELLVVRVDGGGQRLSEDRVLTGCPGSGALGRNRARVLFSTNRRLAHVEPAAMCAPLTPTPTATATSTDAATSTPSPTATRTPTARPSPTVTASPTATATTLPAPIFLPLTLREKCTPTQGRMDVVLVIDASSSMLEPTVSGRSKIATAMAAASTFLDQLHFDAGDQAAVVTFNGDAWLLAVLTSDRVALNAALANSQTAQFTRIDLGIHTARTELQSPRRHVSNQAVMILLTDGKANPEPVETAVHEAQLAKDAGVTLFVIGLGSVENLDHGALRQIASRSRYYYQTTDATALTAIYKEIAGVIPCPPEQYWGRR